VAREFAIKEIRKRDGRIVPFDQEKITNAIFKATNAVGKPDRALAKKLSDQVVSLLLQRRIKLPAVEEVQDTVEMVLIDSGLVDVAKAYIIYRQKRKEVREVKQIAFGIYDELKMSINALKVLESRYLSKDEAGHVTETPKQLFHRVAHNIALADKKFSRKPDIAETEQAFFDLMASLEFMPNSPTLMNAGRPLQQLAACFVLPVDDSIESIFSAIRDAALIFQSGGGCGYSFSRLRPNGDMVKSTHGIASGPVSFMDAFNVITDVIKAGGKRRGANMGILKVDHPDILEFITAKEKEGKLSNFNISVAVTDDFMNAVAKNEDYNLINPRTNKVVKHLNAKKVFDLFITMAWKNGEPGIVFIDEINRHNPTPKLGRIESTNPCGEVPLLGFEACNLGSINLAKMVKDGRVDWDKLRYTVRTSIHFMDNVIEMSHYPLPQITKMVHGNRKLGLGIMGWADMIVQLGVPYDSVKAVKLAERLMRFIRKEAEAESIKLAKKRGVFPNWEKSSYHQKKRLRNATLNSIAPTGTISIIANCSSGIEPLFAVSFVRKVLEGQELLEVNPFFEKLAKERGFYSDTLMRKIALQGSVQGVKEIPKDVQRVFVTSMDIAPDWHIKMQAAFQKHVDNAVSKTINFPNSATTEDIERAFLLAYKLNCKGLTVYRYGSRETQVLNIAGPAGEEKKSAARAMPVTQKEEYCPTCEL
jgi:ribonucleoside-diphosphate reductase alpha chain